VPPEAGQAQRIAYLARDGAILQAGDSIVEFDPHNAEKQAADGKDDLAVAGAKIEKAQAEGARNERSYALDRELAREELDRAESFELKDEKLYSRHQIIESKLDRDLFATKTEVAGRKLEASAELTAVERSLGEIEAGKAKLKLDIAGRSLRALRIVAPHSGLLMLEKSWRGETAFVGDTLWPGEKIAELPDLDQLEARVFVFEADGAGLRAGLAARLVIEGQPGVEYRATVARVEALAKTRDWGSPVRYFEAVLTLPRTEPTKMKPGQAVRATIRLESADNVLVIPRGALFERDGQRVVYRRNGQRFTSAPVTISHQSVARVVVKTGLRPGDRIALRDPELTTAEVFAPGAAGATPAASR
jgi:hypothetical protein